jgi:DNA polymerase
VAVNQQQLDYLSAMGVPVWVSRDLPMPESAVTVLDFEEAISNQNASALVKAVPGSEPSVKGLKAADELLKDLQQTSIKQIADLAASLDETAPSKPEVFVKNFDGVSWAELELAVSQCTACDLHNKRQQTVFGKGSKQASLMIVGDIPRLMDEQMSQPFTGDTGELLSSMIGLLGVEADSIYFTNLLKCRPPLDNSPQANQAASCLSYLKQQIKLLNPGLVILLGRNSAQKVLGKDQSMAQLRLNQHVIEGFDTHFIATYHPAYLLKQPRLKALAWQDLQFISQALSSHG